MDEVIHIIEEFKRNHPDRVKHNNSIISSLCTHSYINENSNNIFQWNSTYCPFFIDEEVEQLRDYYAESTGESYHKYFDEMNNAIRTGSNSADNENTWHEKITALQYKLNYTDDPEERDKIKQSIVDLGWNPEIEYTAESQIMARNRFISLMNKRACNVETVDVHHIVEALTDSDCLNIFNEAAKNQLYPINIVLVRGNSPVSGIITKFTQSDFTHSALAIGTDFNRLYSFNLDNKVNLAGGFSLESIKNYPQEGRLAIYTFFVNKLDYDTLQARLQNMLYNIKNTTYNVANLIFFPFQYIKSEIPDSMICSQFVDSCMKLINIDITNSISAKVSPALLYNSSVKNAKIYKTFDGYVRDFKDNKISSFINKLAKSAKPYKNEGLNILYPVVVEARKIPIEIKDNGDVLITNPFPNFDAEYAASHKLLLQYDKANNIEGTKYELARLYYMNYVLEKKLYHNNFLSNKEKNMKTRARVLNDFNKYMKIVLRAEPNFNFSEYYENSVFYPHTVEVKGSTINKLKNILRYIL